jgi:hypothetical protein
MLDSRPEPSLHRAATLAFAMLFLGGSSAASPALAFTSPDTELSLQNDPLAGTDAEENGAANTKPGMPMPGGLVDKNAAAPAKTDDKADDDSPPAEMVLDPNTLPEAVKKMRVALVEAAASGDIERLRPLMSTGENGTQIAVGDAPDDPIAALKSLSGDPDGREILGIMLDILSTGAALVDKGTPDAQYVWPYFAERPLDSLSPPEQVELYRIVTASDVADMKEFGGYNFYRIGIAPDGKWKFFVAGD